MFINYYIYDCEQSAGFDSSSVSRILRDMDAPPKIASRFNVSDIDSSELFLLQNAYRCIDSFLELSFGLDGSKALVPSGSSSRDDADAYDDDASEYEEGSRLLDQARSSYRERHDAIARVRSRGVEDDDLLRRPYYRAQAAAEAGRGESASAVSSQSEGQEDAADDGRIGRRAGAQARVVSELSKQLTVTQDKLKRMSLRVEMMESLQNQLAELVGESDTDMERHVRRIVIEKVIRMMPMLHVVHVVIDVFTVCQMSA